MIKNESSEYQVAFTNKHSRKIYLALSIKYHRSIYLEITLSVISDCHYADTRSEEILHGLTTIYFPFSTEVLLRIVNKELEGGFTDVAITADHSPVLNRPICGSI